MGDTFAGATVISGASGSVTESNVGAGTEVGEPTPSVNGPVFGTLWFRYTPVSAGTLTLDTQGTTATGAAPVDTVLAVYVGADLASLVEVAADDDSGGPDPLGPSPFTSLLSMAVDAGTTYHIQEGSLADPTEDDVVLRWAFVPAPVVPPPAQAEPDDVEGEPYVIDDSSRDCYRHDNFEVSARLIENRWRWRCVVCDREYGKAPPPKSSARPQTDGVP